ncbi:MAG: hypothetical protein FJY76_02225 [Candidatus Aenigmarchaeota archaeon]|nr:hypothetical protein [Candidatus Aenigmarchaeota archaeon]
MKKGITDVMIVFAFILILTIIILLVLSFFGYNLLDKIAEMVTGALRGIAGFFTNLFGFLK